MMSEYTGRKWFRIHANDAGTEACNDNYVKHLEAEIERLQAEIDRNPQRDLLPEHEEALAEKDAEIDRLRGERNEARAAARTLYNCVTFVDVRQHATKDWPWIVKGGRDE